MSGADQIINSITESQSSEKQLIANLDTLVSQPGFNVNQTGVQSLIKAIQSLSESRVTMFESLSNQAKTLQTGVANSRSDLVSQMTLLNVVEKQLSDAKKNIQDLQGQNDSKKRMIEVNTYYGQHYESQSKLMKMIILFCVPLLIFFILKKKGLLPPMISNYLIGITAAIGFFSIMFKLWDSYTRNNMDFNEYNWHIQNPEAISPSIWEYNKKNFYNFDNPIQALVGNLGSCIGEGCCSNGLYFDKVKQQCTTAAANARSVTESFVCGANNFQATNVVNIDDDEEQKQNGISPFSYSSTYAPIA